MFSSTEHTEHAERGDGHFRINILISNLLMLPG